MAKTKFRPYWVSNGKRGYKVVRYIKSRAVLVLRLFKLSTEG